MTKTSICKLTLCVLLLSPLAPLATARAQSQAPVTGTDPQPINPKVTGTDPQPINPKVTGTDPQPINPTVISILLSMALGIG